MTLELYTNAVLTRNVAEDDRRAGDVVKIIGYRAKPKDGIRLPPASSGFAQGRVRGVS